MPRMNVEGNATDVPAAYALSWAMANMVSTFEIVGAVHWALYFGMPRSSSTRFIRLLEKICETLNENIPIFDDPTLSRAAGRLSPALVAFVDAAKALARWQQTSVPRALRRKHLSESRESGPQEPEWFRNLEGKARIESLDSSYGVYLDALEVTLDDLMALLDQSDPDAYGEQLHRVRQGIPFARAVATLGYVEAIRRAAGPNAQ